MRFVHRKIGNKRFPIGLHETQKDAIKSILNELEIFTRCDRQIIFERYVFSRLRQNKTRKTFEIT